MRGRSPGGHSKGYWGSINTRFQNPGKGSTRVVVKVRPRGEGQDYSSGVDGVGGFGTV